MFQAGIKVKFDEPHKHFEERLEEEKEHASRALTSMLLQDAIDEVRDLQRWAYMEGYDDEMQERLQRLMAFLQGEVVEPQAQ
ncbi:hypothetical protein [Pseudovibrio exalbescens]|uniref:hypothetical protein n=1 Tax=Pseudovibrio exalbescens TaxID=197461 RepID=UPI0011AEE34F|nr:hypothetical protein [Pseudovibrio exalbescens]